MTWVNPPSRDLEKLIFRQLVTKIQAFYQKQQSNLCVNKRLPNVYVLNQINSVHDLQLYLFNIHFSNILSLTRRSSRWSNSFRFRDRNYVSISLLPQYVSHASLTSYSLISSPEKYWWGVKCINPLKAKLNPICPLLAGTAVAQWLRCCATNRKVAGSIANGVIGIFHWYKILPMTPWPWRRLSLQQKWVPGAFAGGKGGPCVRLTTYHHPVPLSWNLGTLTSGWATPGL